MKQIRLSKGLFALVSPEDYDFLSQWKWTASHESRGTKWYAIRFEFRQCKDGLRRRVKVRMHRVVMGMRELNVPSTSSEELFAGKVIDHINHNSLDNRRENLRLLTQRENMLASPGWKRRSELKNIGEEESVRTYEREE